MESYKYKSGPTDKSGDFPEHWALRCTAQELSEYNKWMAKADGLRKPHYPKYEVNSYGLRIITWVESHEL